MISSFFGQSYFSVLYLYFLNGLMQLDADFKRELNIQLRNRVVEENLKTIWMSSRISTSMLAQAFWRGSLLFLFLPQ